MSGPFKMKGHSLPGPNQASPAKDTPHTTTETHKTHTEVTNKQRQENLLKVVPNEEAFNKLEKTDQKGFTDAWIKSEGATKKVKKETVAKYASPLHDHERHSEGWVIEHPNQSSATVRKLQLENQTTKEYDDAMIKKLQEKNKKRKEKSKKEK